MSKTSIKRGVHTAVVPTDRAGQRLDNFLATQLKGVPKSLIYRLIRTGQVRINGGRAKPATRLEAGDEVRVPPAQSRADGDAPIPDWALRRVSEGIVYEDGEVIVLDKPSGMAVHGGSGLPWGAVDVVRALRGDGRIELVHRLDRSTSGCLVFARTRDALQRLADAFREGRVGKRYLCLLDGRLPEDRVDVDAPIAASRRDGEKHMVVRGDGKPARTTFRRLEDFGGYSFVEAELHTGRTHQIRVHAAHLGLPLAGEDRYAEDPDRPRFWRDRGLGRLFLHAHQLSLPLGDDREVLVSAPLPAELREVLDGLA